MEPLFRHILVPVDGSEPAFNAVRVALRLRAACPDCKLTALYVIDKLVLRELIRFSARAEREVETELEDQAYRYLEFVRAEAARDGITVSVLTRKGDPSEEIISVANSLPADLIVMGHTGWRGTARVLIGSVTQRVLDYASCPVLVTRANSAA
jgi:nucleotide-binding universal stress UspA family protein